MKVKIAVLISTALCGLIRTLSKLGLLSCDFLLNSPSHSLQQNDVYLHLCKEKILFFKERKVNGNPVQIKYKIVSIEAQNICSDARRGAREQLLS